MDSSGLQEPCKIDVWKTKAPYMEPLMAQIGLAKIDIGFVAKVSQQFEVFIDS
jgi:hypothetical protein